MLVVEKKRANLVDGPTCRPLDQLEEQSLNRLPKKRFISDLIALKHSRARKDAEKSKLFMAIGFTISLLLVIMAFEWKTYDKGELVDLGTITSDFNEILEIPPTEQPPPPPPQKIMSPVIKEVADEVMVEEIELELDVEVTEETVIEEISNFEFVGNEVPEEKAETIYDIVQSRPEPVGGLSAFYKYVQENMEYPEKAKRMRVSGRVYIQFVVEKDGSLTDIQVIKSLYEACDQEAVRVIENAPNWIPGKQRGQPVRVYQRIPIMFILRN